MMPRRRTENGSLLFSRIELSAELRSRISRVKKELQAYSGLHLIREGTVLVYEIMPDDDEHYYTAEFGANSIALSIHARKTPVLFLHEALLRLVALLQLTSDCYEVRLRSLYPYLVLALAGGQLSSLQSNKKESQERQGNIVLSRKLLSLISESKDLKKNNTELASRLRKTIVKSIIISGRERISTREFAAELGIAEKEVTDALSFAEDVGYRVVRYGNDIFGLVKSWQT